MTSNIKRIFKNITPLFVLTIFGVIVCLGEIVILFLSKDQGELATGVLAMWALGLYVVFLVDRYIIKTIAYKKVIALETIFLLLFPFMCLYLSKDTRIYVDTERSYFVLVYSGNGLTKKQIPSNGLFDHTITFKNDSVIYLDYTLLNDNSVYVLEPKSWHGYKAKYLDTVIRSNKLQIEMRTNDLSNEQRDGIFKKLLPTLHL